MGEYTDIEIDSEDIPKWAYLSEDGQEHSWYSDKRMQQWFECGYFPENLQIRTIDDGKYFTLQEYMQLCGGVSPFLGNVTVDYHPQQHLQEYRRPQHQYTTTTTRSSNNQLDYYEQQRQQQITPIIPLHHHHITALPGYPTAAAAAPPTPTTNGNSSNTTTTNATALPYFINNAFTAAAMPMMYPPPGMEQFDEHQILYQGYGIERNGENPSSSSVSETPDSERCLHMMEDMQISLPTFDKCVGTDDAPWISRTVDFGTDTPEFPSTGIECGVQTGTIFLKPKDVSRLLKELTGINYYIR